MSTQVCGSIHNDKANRFWNSLPYTLYIYNTHTCICTFTYIHMHIYIFIDTSLVVINFRKTKASVTLASCPPRLGPLDSSNTKDSKILPSWNVWRRGKWEKHFLSQLPSRVSVNLSSDGHTTRKIICFVHFHLFSLGALCVHVFVWKWMHVHGGLVRGLSQLTVI